MDITTVFSGDGTYLLGNVSKECNYADYPKMIRDSMLSVLRELKARDNWRPGDTVRVMFHAHRPLKRIDVGKIVFACVREIGAEQVLQMAFVTVSHDHPFCIMDRAEKGKTREARKQHNKKGVRTGPWHNSADWSVHAIARDKFSQAHKAGELPASRAATYLPAS